MNAEKYAKQVAGHLKCSGKRKREIRRQIASDVQAAMEEGGSLEQVLQDMGEPKALAAEFNESFGEGERRVIKRARLWKILAAVCAVLLLLAAVIWWSLPKSKFLMDSRTFSKEQVQERAELILELFDQGDYETMRSYMDERLREVITGEILEQNKQILGTDWGGRIAIGNSYLLEVSQFGRRYAVVQMTVSYENTGAVYTMSFDRELRLAGFYMQ